MAKRNTNQYGRVIHYPINGNMMLKAVCLKGGLVAKTTDRRLVTCPECLKRTLETPHTIWTRN